MNGGGVFGALVFVIGVLILFAILFGFFLIVPFFIFLAGIVVMLVGDRRNASGGNGNGNGNGKAKETEVVEVVETTEVREVKS